MTCIDFKQRWCIVAHSDAAELLVQALAKYETAFLAQDSTDHGATHVHRLLLPSQPHLVRFVMFQQASAVSQVQSNQNNQLLICSFLDSVIRDRCSPLGGHRQPPHQQQGLWVNTVWTC